MIFHPFIPVSLSMRDTQLRVRTAPHRISTQPASTQESEGHKCEAFALNMDPVLYYQFHSCFRSKFKNRTIHERGVRRRAAKKFAVQITATDHQTRWFCRFRERDLPFAGPFVDLTAQLMAVANTAASFFFVIAGAGAVRILF